MDVLKWKERKNTPEGGFVILTEKLNYTIDF